MPETVIKAGQNRWNSYWLAESFIKIIYQMLCAGRFKPDKSMA
jgi:hypothetical protein